MVISQSCLLLSSYDVIDTSTLQFSFCSDFVTTNKFIEITLQDRYLVADGGVRIGRLLEDMDIFAVHLGSCTYYNIFY